LLLLAFSICSYAQSLGDVARELRAERQDKNTPRARVITNDDIESAGSAPVVSQPATQPATQDGAGNEAAENATAASSGGVASKSAQGRNDSAKEREVRELETQKRTDEINKVYLDRIAAVRAQIDGAQADLARLQRDQAESTIEFQRSVGTSPSIAEYEQQQRLFNEQIEVQRNLIDSLKARLEDAQEAARHAGVPRASD
jgi:hypothetical protein